MCPSEVHPSVHVTLLMPVSELDLVPQSKASPAPCLIDGGPAYTVWQILDVQRQGRDSSTWWTGRGTALRSDQRLCVGTSWMTDF